MDFEIIGEIGQIETISRGSGIRNYTRWQRQYGQGRWRKLNGVVYVQQVDSSVAASRLYLIQLPINVEKALLSASRVLSK